MTGRQIDGTSSGVSRRVALVRTEKVHVNRRGNDEAVKGEGKVQRTSSIDHVLFHRVAFSVGRIVGATPNVNVRGRIRTPE